MANARADFFSTLVSLALASCAVPAEETGIAGGALGGSDRGAAAAAPTTSACTAASACTSEPSAKTSDCTFFVGFDGSGVYSPDVRSNVGRLYEEIGGPPAKGGPRGRWSEIVEADTRRAYIEGVPSIVASHSSERVDRGRSALCQHFAHHPPGTKDACDVVLVGYSRGAIIANQIAWVIDQLGCPDGRHRGTTIKLVGAFDPVNTQMGRAWTDGSGVDHPWQMRVPPNVGSYLQVYKSTLSDPRGGIEGIVLGTSLLDGAAAGTSCDEALDKSRHPSGQDWHHGEIGHFDLPRDAMKCAIERAQIAFGR